MKPVYLSILQKETGTRIKTLLKEKGYTVKDIQEAMDLNIHRPFINGSQEIPCQLWITLLF